MAARNGSVLIQKSPVQFAAVIGSLSKRMGRAAFALRVSTCAQEGGAWACLRPALELKRNLDLGFSAGFSAAQWKIYIEDFSVKNLKDFTGMIHKFCVILHVLSLG